MLTFTPESDALTDNERSILALSDAIIVVLDRGGDIIGANPAWSHFANLNEIGVHGAEGRINYFEFCERSALGDGKAIADSLRDHLIDGSGVLKLEYNLQTATGDSWAALSAARVNSGGGPLLVVSQYDMTRQREAHAALQKASEKLAHAEETERRRIARELHDGTGQYITAAKLMLGSLEGGNREEVAKLLACAMEELRSLAFVLHPPSHPQQGLPSAIRDLANGYARRAGLTIDIELQSDFPKIGVAAEHALYRITQEALANVHRHSQSARAHVSLRLAGEMALLSIRDFGVGLAPGRTAESGVGHESMRLRLAALNGFLSLHNADPGLLVEAWIPLRPLQRRPLESNAGSSALDRPASRPSTEMRTFRPGPAE